MPISERDTLLAQQIARAYSDAEARILTRLSTALASGVDAPDWEIRTLARLSTLRLEATKELSGVADDVAQSIMLRLAMLYGEAGSDLLGQLSAAKAGLQPENIASSTMRASVRAIADELTQSIGSAATMLLRGTDDAYRDVVGRVVQSVTARGESKRSALARATREFFAKGLPSFKDQAGRTWSIQSYVDMAVRTGFAGAQIKGHEDALDAARLDLVIIQPGPRACDICDQWARKVLSRSGATGTVYATNALTGKNTSVRVDGTLAEARAAGFQHPNCRCSIRAFIPGVTKRSEINRPPWDEEGYERQQQQRAHERKVREAKMRLATAQASGDPREIARAKSLLRQRQGALRDHLAANPYLKRRSDREQIVKPDSPSNPVEFVEQTKPVPPAPDVVVPDQRTLLQRFTKSEPRSMSDSASSSNPHRALTADYRTNCHYCAPTVELRARGYDVIARPTAKQQGRTDGEIAFDWRDAEGNVRNFTHLNTYGRTGATALRELAAQMPDGARGFIAGAWARGGGGHIYNWEKRLGEIVFHEGQNHASSEAVAGSYLRQMKFASVTVLRVDDLEPAEGAEHAVQAPDEGADAAAIEVEIDRVQRELDRVKQVAAEMQADKDRSKARFDALVDKIKSGTVSDAERKEFETLALTYQQQIATLSAIASRQQALTKHLTELKRKR